MPSGVNIGAKLAQPMSVTVLALAPTRSARGMEISGQADVPADLVPEGTSALTVKAMQSDLHERGFYMGPVDGNANPPTCETIRKYQRSHYLPQTRHGRSALRTLGME